MTARPATRVDNWVIFPGGHSRKLTWRERIALRLGIKSTVRLELPPRR